LRSNIERDRRVCLKVDTAPPADSADPGRADSAWALGRRIPQTTVLHEIPEWMTKAIIDIAGPLGISVHDHIIVGKNGHASMRGLKLI
jgi:hypothetical protein